MPLTPVAFDLPGNSLSAAQTIFYSEEEYKEIRAETKKSASGLMERSKAMREFRERSGAKSKDFLSDFTQAIASTGLKKCWISRATYKQNSPDTLVALVNVPFEHPSFLMRTFFDPPSVAQFRVTITSSDGHTMVRLDQPGQKAAMYLGCLLGLGLTALLILPGVAFLLIRRKINSAERAIRDQALIPVLKQHLVPTT